MLELLTWTGLATAVGLNAALPLLVVAILASLLVLAMASVATRRWWWRRAWEPVR